MIDSRIARRRAQFPKLKSWHLNRSGNWQIELREFRVTVFQKPMGWGAVINHPSKPEGMFTRETYNSFAEAQLAAFDVFALLEKQTGGR
jgi:hypothetical protein